MKNVITMNELRRRNDIMNIDMHAGLAVAADILEGVFVTISEHPSQPEDDAILRTLDTIIDVMKSAAENDLAGQDYSPEEYVILVTTIILGEI